MNQYVAPKSFRFNVLGLIIFMFEIQFLALVSVMQFQKKYLLINWKKCQIFCWWAIYKKDPQKPKKVEQYSVKRKKGKITSFFLVVLTMTFYLFAPSSPISLSPLTLSFSLSPLTLSPSSLLSNSLHLCGRS